MQVDKTEKIGSLPIKRVRDFLRSLDDDSFSEDRVTEFFKVTPNAAKKITKELVARKLLTLDPIWPGNTDILYRVDAEGSRLANAHFRARINRAKADGLAAEFLKRVRKVNGQNELTHVVTEVRTFGSYIDDGDDLGDIDLALGLAPRRPDGDWVKECIERAQQSGRRHGSFMRVLAYSQTEVRQILKAKSPYLSLHDLAELDRLGCRSKLLFEA